MRGLLVAFHGNLLIFGGFNVEHKTASSERGYWYLGPLKTKAAHFFSTLKLTCVGCIHTAPQEVSPEVWKEVQLSTLELSITTRNSQLDLASKEDFMNICMEPNTVSKGDFITLGRVQLPALVSKVAFSCTNRSKKVSDPKLHVEGTECLQASRCTLLLPEGTGGAFSIDSEEYEAMPVEVKLLPRKLQFFCDPRRREQLLQRPAQ
ncbi:AGK [Cervus elaphus hippelaphus]|uniref:AGK n=1 Tax=Cervus elaphus hippelaphus TaxID=46360 RepID=A0A212CKF6_CEREH|nr:AGK [Cervus elaphus hippelaphus]